MLRLFAIFCVLFIFSSSNSYTGELVIGLDSALEKKPDSIEELCLGGSAIAELPETFCDLVNLKYLNMAQNDLIALPKCMANFSKLTELNLSANKLEEISAINSMASLISLDLSGNENLDTKALEALEGLERLQTLDLSYLNIVNLPKSIYLLKNLKELILTGVNIDKKNIENLKQINPNLHIIL
jgi:leucine-rich repeat protein SHOC2